jgi:2-C-methyl-D-erythritol 4-phosphate cytidylyltransferase
MTSDPYDPKVETEFKNRASRLMRGNLEEAVSYWLERERLYGTPQGSDVRSLMQTFKRLAGAYAAMTAQDKAKADSQVRNAMYQGEG